MMNCKLFVDARMWRHSGIGTYIRNLIMRMPMAIAESTVLLLPHGVTVNFPGQIIVRDIPLFSPRGLWRLRQLVTELHPQLCWSPQFNIPWYKDCPLIATIHDVFQLAMPQVFGNYWRQRYAKFLIKRAIKQSTKIIAVSEFTKQEIVKFTGVDAAKICVIHNGVDEDWFGQLSDQSLYTKPYILFVGNVKPNKNLQRLLQAFSLIKDELSVDLLLAGKMQGFASDDTEVLREASLLQPRVTMTGAVSARELRNYYQHALAVIIPSLYEGFGLTALEAMASRVPVLSSSSASLPEICQQSALYFDPLDCQDMANAMRKAVSDTSWRQQIIELGDKRVRQFNWQYSADQHWQIMSEYLHDE